jgi:hypothetical protein
VKGHTEKDAREAKRHLERMQEQSEKLITGSRDHDDDEHDPVVILGRRIGRGLGLIIGAGLLVYLIATYVAQ